MPEKENFYKLNSEINSNLVRVINQNNEQSGIMELRAALILAEKSNLDLVQVNNGNPPVCKIMDFNKFKFELKKKEKESKKKQVFIEIKEIQIHMTTAENDLLIKAKQLEKFLSKGNHVRITMSLRGRESGRTEEAIKVMNDFLEILRKNDIAFKMKSEIKAFGKNIECCVMPG